MTNGLVYWKVRVTCIDDNKITYARIMLTLFIQPDKNIGKMALSFFNLTMRQ